MSEKSEHIYILFKNNQVKNLQILTRIIKVLASWFYEDSNQFLKYNLIFFYYWL